MIIAAFMVMASAFNQDINGLVFMGGAMIIMFMGQFPVSSQTMNVLLKQTLKGHLFIKAKTNFRYLGPRLRHKMYTLTPVFVK